MTARRKIDVHTTTLKDISSMRYLIACKCNDQVKQSNIDKSFVSISKKLRLFDRDMHNLDKHACIFVWTRDTRAQVLLFRSVRRSKKNDVGEGSLAVTPHIIFNTIDSTPRPSNFRSLLEKRRGILYTCRRHTLFLNSSFCLRDFSMSCIMWPS